MTKKNISPDIFSWEDIEAAMVSPSDDLDADLSLYSQYILVEGDSWVSFGGIPTSNLLLPMRFGKLTMIANCALPGDTIKNMSHKKNKEFSSALSIKNIAWSCIVLSGGGNDLINGASSFIVSPTNPASNSGVADFCDSKKLFSCIEDVQNSYKALVKLRDSKTSSSGVPIVVHTYDYITPRNSPARFLGIAARGPWLFKALRKKGVPKKMWLKISDYIIDELAKGIIDLGEGGSEEQPNFHVVDTRGTLNRAELDSRGRNNDWVNEIHPNANGYEKLANRLIDKIDDFL